MCPIGDVNEVVYSVLRASDLHLLFPLPGGGGCDGMLKKRVACWLHGLNIEALVKQ